MPIIGIHSSPTESETLGVEPRNVCFSKLMFPDGSDGKESACNAGVPGSIPGLEIPLEKRMATHSSILAWRIPWTEEPGRV